MSTPTIAPPLPPPLWPDPPPPPPPPSESNRDPNRPYVIGMVVAAVMIPVLAVGWAVLSGVHGATPKATVAKTFSDQAIVNINGVIPNGFIAGTGMVLTSTGLVLTNNHVVANTSALTGQLAGRGPIYPAVVVGVDPTEDVAVIQLEGAVGLPVTPFDLSGSLAVGDPVTGRGNAGGLDGAPLSATGAVTSLDETISVEDEDATIVETLDGVVCFNAPIRPGDSGGPLLESSGKVIGMDTAGALTNASGAASNWGCAIPITRAITIAHEIESGTASPYIESGHRGILGVAVVTKAGGEGCVVTSVTAGDAAATAGLVAGDVITTVGGIPVPSMADFNFVMQDRRPGDDVAVIWHDASGAQHTAVAVLSAGPPA